jgi:hypothetical protein
MGDMGGQLVAEKAKEGPVNKMAQVEAATKTVPVVVERRQEVDIGKSPSGYEQKSIGKSIESRPEINETRMVAVKPGPTASVDAPAPAPAPAPPPDSSTWVIIALAAGIPVFVLFLFFMMRRRGLRY